jgi:hypothetical protein
MAAKRPSEFSRAFQGPARFMDKEMRRVSDSMNFMLSLTRRRIFYSSIAGLERPA